MCVIKSPLRGSSENFSTCFIITCWRIRAQCLKILRCMQASIREVYHVTKYLSLTIIIKTILKISFGKFKTVKSCSNCCPEIMFERHLHKTLWRISCRRIILITQDWKLNIYHVTYYCIKSTLKYLPKLRIQIRLLGRL